MTRLKFLHYFHLNIYLTLKNFICSKKISLNLLSFNLRVGSKLSSYNNRILNPQFLLY